MSDRTIIIGDLHGCYVEARKLLALCETHVSDHVIFLGDLVDRGPESGKCVDLVMHREQVQGKPACILGNHEEKHLFYRDIEERKGKVEVQVETHVKTRSQLLAHHYDYFRAMPKYLRLPEHNAVCVHAGVFPGRSIEEQTDRHLLHIQMIKPFTTDEHGNQVVNEKSMWSSKAPVNEGWKFWTEFYDGPERIIFGNSVLNKPLVSDKVVGLDGGGCFGLELWALILPENKIVTIKCTRKNDQGDLGRRGNPDRKLYPIRGEIGTY